MRDEMLDPITHDISYSNYDEATVDGIDQCIQNIKIRLLIIKGEFFGNENLGTIDFSVLESKRNTKTLVDAAIRATIQDTPDVSSILSYTSTLDGEARTLAVTFRVNTVYGTSEQQNVEIIL